MKSCPSCHSTYPTDFALCPRDGTTLVESGLWHEGTLVRGKYRILSRLGGGGMATVYKAVHTRFGEVKALKVMLPELANDPNFVKRFTHEAVLTRKLQHPSAVRVEDIDEAEDGRPFIVMEYIHGSSLKTVIQQGSPMAVERVCAIVKQVASALDAAHGLGIVHRDIKPANIVLLHAEPDLVTGDAVTQEVSLAPVRRTVAQSLNSSELDSPEYPIAKVLDFGIARIKEGRFEDPQLSQMTLTGAGMVVGTPAYMSPEQAAGKRGSELDGRSDLYSLGVVMYQMLAGELPLKADSEMAMMIAHIQNAPADIRTRRPDVPEPLARLVMRCLEKNPDDRPASGRALIEEIECWERESARLQAARRQAEEERRKAEAERRAREEAEALETARRTREAEEARARERAEAELMARQQTEALQREESERKLRQTEEAAAQQRGHAERRAREEEEELRRRSAAERRARSEEAQRRSEAELRALRAVEARTRGAGETAKANGEPATQDRSRRSKVVAMGVGMAAVLAIGVALFVYLGRVRGAGVVRSGNSTAASPAVSQAAPEPQTSPAVNPQPAASAQTAGSDRKQPESSATTALPAERISDLTRRGDAYYNNAEYDAAVKQYQRASTLDPGNRELQAKIQRARNEKEVSAFMSRGDAQYQNGQYDNAIEQYQKALALDPGNPELPSKIKKAQTARDTEKALAVP